MQKPFVYLFALILPALLFGESFKVTIDRPAHLGTATLQPGEYKVNIDGGKAEFQKGNDKVTADVKQENLPAKATSSFIRYTNAPENRINEIVTRGSMVRWLFP
jgi:hypothetical protein